MGNMQVTVYPKTERKYKTIMTEAELPSFLLELDMGECLSYTVERAPDGPSALAVMADKLDNMRPDTTGYLTHLPEIRAIMSELTDLVSAAVVVNGEAEGLVCAQVIFGFAIERDLL